ncbi:MAG: metallophosphoesterase [Oscillospiraceae bacterium]|nr:metallophosphoesterase [Oscillospiraceae bacterium]
MKTLKLLVFSDTHGLESNIEKAIKAHGEKADALIFLGDGILGANEIFGRYPHIPHVCVRGNCDLYASSEVDEALVDIGGIKILCMHGHKYSVKGTIMRAVYRAREREADLLLFGHTHEPLCRKEEGIVVFNPGSLGLGYPERTYGVVEIADGEIICGHGKL